MMKHPIGWLLWLVAFGLGGCFSPQFDDGKIACGPNNACPPGLECASGVCRTHGSIDAALPPSAPMLTSITPTSPSNVAMPMVLGTAQANTTVNLYSDAGCTMMIGSGTAAQLASPGIQVTVAANTTTMIFATATSVGGTSPCSTSSLTYTEDSIAPAAPVLQSTMPTSPSRSLTPTAHGTAEAASVVKLYGNTTCTGTMLGMATTDASGNFAIMFTVASGSTTMLSATATDAAGNVSTCSTSPLSYTHDASAVTPPSFTSTTPTSPSNTSTTPTINGHADPNVVVKLYIDNLCTSAVAGTGVTTAAGMFSIGVTVTANTSTTFYGQATDTGVLSACSQTGITYTHDNIAPVAPVITGSSPASPSNSSTPNIDGTAEASAVVTLYTNSACTGTPVSSGSATAGGTFAIPVTVSATTTYYALATDLAGNASPCSAAGYQFVYDITPPAAPTLTGTSPASPSSSNTTPIVIGTAENGSTVKVYRSSNCTGAVAGSGLASPGFGITISVPSNSTSTLTATATDAAGNTSACSTAITYTHDSIAPNAPVLTSTNPASPSNSNTPMVMGTAEANSTVQLYTDAACTTSIGAATVANGSGMFGVTVTVTNNATTTFYAHATDAAGNVGACSSGLSFTEDSIAPATPTINSLPPSNSNTTPTLTGTAEASSTVKIYQSSSCGGTAVAMGTASAGATFSIMVTVTANTSTTFTATATDAAGNVSGCSAPMTYTHDNIAPARPTGLASAPTSPAPSTTPTITGMAEANSTVYLFTNPTCSSGVAGTATANGSGAFSIPVTVPNASTTTFYATATDAANNTSPCSTSFVTYTQDSVPPAVPSGLASTPTSPGNSTTPTITGNAEAGSTVKLYTASGCTGAVAAQGTAAGGGTFSIMVTVTANVTTTFFATATDAAGNVSGCTASGLSYTEDSVPPAAPSGLSTTPPSPANNTNPTILGTTEANAHVVAYSNSGCTTSAGSTTANGSGAFSIPVTVTVNTTTTFYLVATDAAGNSSTCGAAGSTISYQDDNSAVATPVLTSTTPTSPSNSSTTPTINGTTSASFTITLYTNSTCTSAVAGTGTADAAGNFSISVTVTANTTTTFYAIAKNLAMTASACSSGISYTHDNIAPAAPTGLGVLPASPSNNTTPQITGTAEANSTVKVFSNSTCSAPAAGQGTATGGAFSIMVSAPLNATTTYYANATDAAGNVSACSTANVAYTEDSQAPNTPIINNTAPPSPANNNNPTVNGTAEAGSTVKIYTSGACTSAVASGTATGGSFAIPVAVASNVTTPLYATATDAAGNTSTCTSTPFNYTSDSIPPAVPTLTSTTPVSPSNNSSPTVNGSTGESGATIKIYGTSNCTGTVLGTGTSAAGGAFAVVTSVPLNTASTLYATATDAAGNTSACSTTALNYTEDSIAPNAPSGLGTNPLSPSNSKTPSVTGTTEAGSTVQIFANNACTGSAVASQTVPAGGTSFSIMVTVTSNSTTTFYANATDAAGNVSACTSAAAAVTYVEDEIANPPSFTSTTPASPSSTTTTPVINGTADAEAGETVTLYTNATCTAPSVASGAPDPTTGVFAISVSVTSNTATTFYGTLKDQAGNTSACSTSSIKFINDTMAPTFNGATTATANGANSILVQWLAASDNFTQPQNMTYQVCAATTPGGCTNTFTVSATVTGMTSVTVTSLPASHRYWIQVRAVDEAGNIGAPNPQVEVTDKTWGSGATKLVAAGFDFTCTLLSNGTVQCWGNNFYGQLGNGTNTSSTTPVAVSGLHDVVWLAAGGASLGTGSSSACAVKSDGTAWCWGRNSSGQLGNNTTTDSNVPVQVMGLTNVLQIAISSNHACAVLATGNVNCWGYNQDGELGSGNMTYTQAPVSVSPALTNARYVEVGYFHSCALLADGTVKCWGSNTDGEIGNGNNTNQLSPTSVSFTAPDRARALSVGGFHACVVTMNGQVRCWGANTAGQLGNGGTTASNTPVVAQVPGGAALIKVKAIAAGGGTALTTNGTTCTVQSDGTQRCWGYNAHGQVGNGMTTSVSQAAVVTGSANAAQVSVGNEHECTLGANGALLCAGNDASSQLGDGGTTSRSTQVAVSGLFATESATSLASRKDFACARMSNGRVFCWGNNGNGQYGDGDYNTKGYPELPVEIGGSPVTNLLSTSVCSLHGCGVRGDGTGVCWGGNSNGELGNGGTTGNNSPTQVLVPGNSALADIVMVASGANHSCALIVDGTVQCWGYNGYGELGTGNYTNTTTAAPVMGLSTAVAIVAESLGTCALLVDGSVQCWGYNGNGECGDTTTTTRNAPVTVSGVSNAVDIAAGDDHACAVLAGGAMKCWGYGFDGEMGNGTTTQINSTPVAVGGGGYTHAGAGDFNICATKIGGSVACWGQNNYGEVGDGVTMQNSVSSPTAATGLATTFTAFGGLHSCSLQSNGTADCWGNGASGAVGDNSTGAHSVSTPQAVIYFP